MKKFNIIFLILLFFLTLACGVLLGKYLFNNFNPLSANKLIPTITSIPVSMIKNRPNEDRYFFNKNIIFPYEKSWQFIENQKEETTINFLIKSLCINKKPKSIIPNSEMNCDITIADYLPLKEQKTILNLNQFVDFISFHGQDDTLPTPFMNNLTNDNNILIIKSRCPHVLSGDIIEGYFFQYFDRANQLHFVHIFGDPVRVSAGDLSVKSFVDQIIKTININ